MKAGVILWSAMALLGVVGSFWNFGQLFFTALPSGVLATALYIEYRQEKAKKSKTLRL